MVAATPSRARWRSLATTSELMVVKSGSGYVVKSESGKRLSKKMSRAGAIKRLRQIEYFKHRDARGGK